MFRAGLVLACLWSSAALAQDAVVPAFVPQEGAAVCHGSAGYAGDLNGARTFLWRPHWLEALAADDIVRSEITEEADAALERGPYSVTHKPRPVPGSSINDYASIGPYWWPSGSGDGLPYTHRDGEVNPERDGPEFDRNRLRQLARDMRALALAYHLSGNEAYAAHGAMLARTWFVDPATRMNPNLDFAQGIPGRVNGRGEGIIEASDLSTVIEALGLLWPSDALSAQDRRALTQWYTNMAVWMATSDNGADEMAKTNNHGVFYDFYLAHFALFAGAPDVVTNVASNFPEFRLGVQMDRQGRFIEELRRTRSWHYSHYVVDGAARLATIAECVDIDLWSARLEDGRGLQTALDFLARYDSDPATWPFADTDLDAGRIDRMNRTAAELQILTNRATTPDAISELP